MRCPDTLFLRAEAISRERDLPLARIMVGIMQPRISHLDLLVPLGCRELPDYRHFSYRFHASWWLPLPVLQPHCLVACYS